MSAETIKNKSYIVKSRAYIVVYAYWLDGKAHYMFKRRKNAEEAAQAQRENRAYEMGIRRACHHLGYECSYDRLCNEIVALSALEDFLQDLSDGYIEYGCIRTELVPAIRDFATGKGGAQ